MNIELVVIGNEVLAGFTINTNASFIGKELFKQGYKLTCQHVVPDEAGSIQNMLSEALDRSDLVITTGGLGPTIDDISRKVAADLFDSTFHYHKGVAEDLAKRFPPGTPTLEDQATIPSKAKPILNTIGTAPGLIFSNEKGTLIMLPGVPIEMKPMFTQEVIPYILENFPLKKKTYRKALHLSKLLELQVDPTLRELKKKYPDVDFGIYPALALLSVQLTADTEESLEAPYRELIEKFGEVAFESPSGTIEEAVQLLFTKNNWTLGIAESCTGGSVAARLTQLPGASEYFLGSIVSYSNALKHTALQIPNDLIETKGAVSEEVVVAMAEGVFKLIDCDFSIAVTGIAGPTGGSEEKPVGTVWFALARRGERPQVWKVHSRGNRSMVIIRSVNEILGKLYHYARKIN